MQLSREMVHSIEIKVLGGLYGFNGFFCFIYVVWLSWYMLASNGWILFFMYFTWLAVICLAFFLTAYGVLRRRNWARPLGLILSIGSVAFMLLSLPSIRGVVRYLLDHQEAPLLYLLGLSSLLLLVTNPLCLYYLTRPPVKQYLGSAHKR